MHTLTLLVYPTRLVFLLLYCWNCHFHVCAVTRLSTVSPLSLSCVCMFCLAAKEQQVKPVNAPRRQVRFSYPLELPASRVVHLPPQYRWHSPNKEVLSLHMLASEHVTARKDIKVYLYSRDYPHYRVTSTFTLHGFVGKINFIYELIYAHIQTWVYIKLTIYNYYITLQQYTHT